MSRPKLDDSEKRTPRMMLRCSEAEWSEVLAAYDESIPLARWVREALLQHLRRMDDASESP